MSAFLTSDEFCQFSLIVGFCATCIYDVWTLLLRAMGFVVIDWGLFGRWLMGLFRGRVNICRTCLAIPEHVRAKRRVGVISPLVCGLGSCRFAAKPTRAERCVGWMLHYVFGIFYAMLLPAFWGAHYIERPTLAPALLVGFCLTSFSAQFVVLPGLKRRHTAKPRVAPILHALLLTSHIIYAMTLFWVAGHVMPLIADIRA